MTTLIKVQRYKRHGHFVQSNPLEQARWYRLLCSCGWTARVHGIADRERVALAHLDAKTA